MDSCSFNQSEYSRILNSQKGNIFRGHLVCKMQIFSSPRKLIPGNQVIENVVEKR